MAVLPRLRTVAAALVLAGCTGGGQAEPALSTPAEPAACPGGLMVPAARSLRSLPPPAPVDDPVLPAGEGLDVVALLPHSGELGFLGAATTAAVELAVEDVDAAGGVLGRPVHLAHVDSAEGTSGAAEAGLAEHLAAGADAVVGPLSSSVAAAVLPSVAASGAVLITPGATASALDTVDGAGRLFRTVAAEAVQGRALAELVLDDGAREVGLVVRADDHGRAVAEAFTDAFAAGGGRVHRIERHPADEAVDPGPLATGDMDADGLDAAVLVGLADTAPVVEALVAAGQRPRERLTYGTDGNLGDRLGDLVEVTTGGRPCHGPARCLQLVRSGADVALVGASGACASTAPATGRRRRSRSPLSARPGGWSGSRHGRRADTDSSRAPAQRQVSGRYSPRPCW